MIRVESVNEYNNHVFNLFLELWNDITLLFLWLVSILGLK